MNFVFNKELSEDLLLIDDKIFLSFSDKLNKVKSLIDDYPKEWEIIKKKIHEYEYIYTSSYYKKNISRISPISRSYFKFREIYEDYNLLNTEDDNYHIVCLAEAPGGFIQSILHTLSKESIEVIHGITLLSDDKKIPMWNRSLKGNPKIKFHTGVKGNGDLYDLQNVLSFIKDIGKNSVHLITGDGGFDYSQDYSKQEENSLKLIYSEIFIALNLQIIGGSFVCKLFDIFSKNTINLIHILRINYDKIILHKPSVSRFSNSEKYIICIGYKGYNQELINYLCHHFNDNEINLPMCKYFIKDIVNFNNIYCKKQIEHIHSGIEMIKNHDLEDKPTTKQIQIAIEWCKKYNIPVNFNCLYI